MTVAITLRLVGPGEPVQALERGGGRMRLEGVRAQGVAELGHDRRRLNAPPGDVADREPDAPVVELEHVVPVSPHLDAGAAGYEARRQPHARDLGQALGNEASLEHIGALALGDVADRARHEDAFAPSGAG